MLNQFSRTELAIGPEGLNRLKGSSVLVLGMGGVGSYTAEALARTGVGKLILVDKDDVDITNINRQLHALLTTIGQQKVELMKERIALINPECEVVALKMFYNEETYEEIFSHHIDYVADAMDTISCKVHLMIQCINRHIPIISSMGAANKLDPTQFKVTDISKTSYDPIARIVRSSLKKVGITKGIKVVFSKEKAMPFREDVRQKIVPENAPEIRKAKQPPSSNAFVPPVAGYIMASVVVRDILHDLLPSS
ncbi:MAG: tRNA threonylcarbamoyladenosine dehydratase [Bacilli bacterium]